MIRMIAINLFFSACISPNKKRYFRKEGEFENELIVIFRKEIYLVEDEDISRNDLLFYSKLWSIYEKYKQIDDAIREKDTENLKSQYRRTILLELKKLEIVLPSIGKQDRNLKLIQTSSRRLDEILNELSRIEMLLEYLHMKSLTDVKIPTEKENETKELLQQIEDDFNGKVKQYKREVKTRIDNGLAKLKNLLKECKIKV